MGQEIRIEECILCGLCSTVCPMGVFELQENSDGKILLDIKRVGAKWDSAVFICSRYKGSLKGRPDGVEIRCVGRVSEELLIGTIGLGIKNVYLYVGDECADCRQAQGVEVAKGVVRRAKAFFRNLGLSQTIDLTCHLPLPLAKSSALCTGEEEVDEGRRALFRALKGLNGKKLLKVALEPRTNKKFTWSHSLPQKRRILLEALSRLVVPASARAMEDFPWPGLTLVGECTFCQACEHVCPTGALRVEVGDDGARLWFNHSYCTACGVCLQICPEGALGFWQEGPLSSFITGKPVLLGAAPSRRCTVCAKKYFSTNREEKYCVTCKIYKKEKVEIAD